MERFSEAAGVVILVLFVFASVATPTNSERSYLRHWLDQTISDDCSRGET